jgi:hypothetical protein
MPPRTKADADAAEPAAPAVPLNAHQAIVAVMGDLEAIKKARKIQSGPAKFAFRGVDDVMNALHDPLVNHGLVILPQAQERLTETRATGSGGTMNVTHLRVRFQFIGPDGSSVYAEAWGEGQDSGDKSTGKAHSMAYKSALLQAFHIETEDTPDADSDTTPAAPVQEQTQEPAAPEPHPALDELQGKAHALTAAQTDYLQEAWIKRGWSPLSTLTTAAPDAVVQSIRDLIAEAADQPPF